MVHTLFLNSKKEKKKKTNKGKATRRQKSRSGPVIFVEKPKQKIGRNNPQPLHQTKPAVSLASMLLDFKIRDKCFFNAVGETVKKTVENKDPPHGCTSERLLR